MNRFLKWAALLLLINFTAFGASCLPGTLLDYVNLGADGCRAGAVQFNNFELAMVQSGAMEIAPGSVQITPVGDLYHPTFRVTLNQMANAGQLLESMFRFNSTGLLSGASVSLIGAQATGDGAVTGSVEVCPGGNFMGVEPIGCNTSPQSAIAFVIEGDAEPNASTPPFQISSFFDVFVDLTVDGGLTGSAMLSSAEVGVSAVPEPHSAFLIAAGVLVLGCQRLRTRS